MNFKITIGIGIALFVGLFFTIGLFSGISNLISYLNEPKKEEVAKGGPNADWKKALIDYEVEIEIKTEEETEKLESQENQETSKEEPEIPRDPQYYKFQDSDPFPFLSSKSYVVADLDTGKIIASKAKEAIWPIASLTKLMTAVVAIENFDLTDSATVSYSALRSYGEQGGLRHADQISISDLLYPLLLESSNDSAEVLAEFSGRNTFIANMNGKAKSLTLESTYFDDPSGLSYQNVSSPTDLLNLVMHIDKKFPEIFEITLNKDYENDEYKWFSNSRFRNDKDYLGGKNGYTDEALQTLISIWNMPLVELSGQEDEEENKRIVIILLQSNQSEKDTRAVKLWLLENVYWK